MNVCKHAAIIGIDGTVWAQTPKFPALTEYDFEIEEEGGNKRQIKVNEFHLLQQVSTGVRAPSAAGIRFGGEKYIFMNHDSEIKFTQLNKTGGGACICRTRNAIIVGIWEKAEMMTNNMTQNNGDCGMRVEIVAKTLKDFGY